MPSETATARVAQGRNPPAPLPFNMLNPKVKQTFPLVFWQLFYGMELFVVFNKSLGFLLYF